MRLSPTTCSTLAACCLALGLPALAHAQSVPDTLSLAGRSNVMIGIGLTGARDATASGTQTSTHTTGEVGSLAFQHWLRPAVAISISASVLNADATTSGGRSHTNAITPLLFGVSYSPPALALSPSLRPFVAAAAGPYFHVVADAGLGSASSTTESAPGARLALGTHWFVARHFVLSVEGDYHAVGDFAHRDAVTAQATGFGMAMGIGFGWGGR